MNKTDDDEQSQISSIQTINSDNPKYNVICTMLSDNSIFISLISLSEKYVIITLLK